MWQMWNEKVSLDFCIRSLMGDKGLMNEKRVIRFIQDKNLGTFFNILGHPGNRGIRIVLRLTEKRRRGGTQKTTKENGTIILYSCLLNYQKADLMLHV